MKHLSELFFQSYIDSSVFRPFSQGEHTRALGIGSGLVYPCMSLLRYWYACCFLQQWEQWIFVNKMRVPEFSNPQPYYQFWKYHHLTMHICWAWRLFRFVDKLPHRLEYTCPFCHASVALGRMKQLENAPISHALDILWITTFICWLTSMIPSNTPIREVGRTVCYSLTYWPGIF